MRSALRSVNKTKFLSQKKYLKKNPLNKMALSLNSGRLITRCMNIARQFSAKPDFDALVKANKVVVFMKGVPEAPRCGFSNAVSQIFRMHGVNYDAIDVLKDDNIREGIKQFSNWPTIPQVFINGEFVGGCDILLQMHQSGDLIEELKKVGITSALIDKAKEETEKK